MEWVSFGDIACERGYMHVYFDTHVAYNNRLLTSISAYQDTSSHHMSSCLLVSSSSSNDVWVRSIWLSAMCSVTGLLNIYIDLLEKEGLDRSEQCFRHVSTVLLLLANFPGDLFHHTCFSQYKSHCLCVCLTLDCLNAVCWLLLISWCFKAFLSSIWAAHALSILVTFPKNTAFIHIQDSSDTHRSTMS